MKIPVILSKDFDVLLIFVHWLDFSRFVSFFPMIVPHDGGTHLVDRGNSFAFLGVIGSKSIEKYSIWWKNEFSNTF